MKSIIKLCFFLFSLVLFQACTSNYGRNDPTDIYHSVQSREDVATIANIYGCRDYQEVAAINNIQPPYFVYPGQTLRIPANMCGMGTRPEDYPSSQPSTDYHIVSKGDTLYDIARNYNISLNDIATSNDLRPPYTLSIGQQLIINPAMMAPSNGVRFTAAAIRPKPLKPQKLLKARHHKVAKGETLYRISKKYGYSVFTIANWNNISSPYVLSIGQKLIVSPSNVNSYSTDYNTGISSYPHNIPKYHIVKRGETLYSIANRYHLTVKKLSALNGLGGPYHIYPTQRLRLTQP